MGQLTLEQAEAARDQAYDSLLKAMKAIEYEHEGSQIRTKIKRPDIDKLQGVFDYFEGIVTELGGLGRGIIIEEVVPNHE